MAANSLLDFAEFSASSACTTAASRLLQHRSFTTATVADVSLPRLVAVEVLERLAQAWAQAAAAIAGFGAEAQVQEAGQAE